MVPDVGAETRRARMPSTAGTAQGSCSMSKPDSIDPAKVLRQRERGRPWEVIARELGITAHMLRRQVDPEYVRLNDLRLQRQRERYRKVQSGELRRAPDDADAIRLPDEPDTRDLTGRLCGDPLPGRSALAQRQAKQQWWSR